jgi:hypothetical protein
MIFGCTFLAFCIAWLLEKDYLFIKTDMKMKMKMNLLYYMQPLESILKFVEQKGKSSMGATDFRTSPRAFCNVDVGTPRRDAANGQIEYKMQKKTRTRMFSPAGKLPTRSGGKVYCFSLLFPPLLSTSSPLFSPFLLFTLHERDTHTRAVSYRRICLIQ